MDAETLSSLLTTLSCMLPFCTGALGLVALGALLVWFVRRQWQPKNDLSLADERQNMQARLELMRIKLRPWLPPPP